MKSVVKMKSNEFIQHIGGKIKKHDSSHDGHIHSHSHSLNSESYRSEKNLKIAFILTILIMIVEFSGALISGSMALYADSGHILVDASSLLLAWFAQTQVRKMPSKKNTYGYHRMGILASLFNSSLLLAISVILLYEGYLRLLHPEIVNAGIMIIFPIVTLAINIVIGMKLHKDIHSNLNVKSSFFHILGDSLVAVSIIVAGIIIYFTGLYYIDSIISMLIAPIIAIGAFSVINEALNILLEGVPKEINFTAVKKEMLNTPGVKNVHDLHIWSMSKSFKLLSAHILVDEKAVKSSDVCCIIDNVQDVLEKKFEINHAVIQPEFTICDTANNFCTRQNP